MSCRASRIIDDHFEAASLTDGLIFDPPRFLNGPLAEQQTVSVTPVMRRRSDY
jgi:hypothetical protein